MPRWVPGDVAPGLLGLNHMKRYLPLLPALLYMGLIFFMSSRPCPDALTGWPVFLGMKLVHLLEYGFLALLWLGGLTWSTRWTTVPVIGVAVAITFLWGISDEVHQYFVPGRTARVSDALTDLIAAMAAALFWRWLAAYWPRITRQDP